LKKIECSTQKENKLKIKDGKIREGDKSRRRSILSLVGYDNMGIFLIF